MQRTFLAAIYLTKKVMVIFLQTENLAQNVGLPQTQQILYNKADTAIYRLETHQGPSL